MSTEHDVAAYYDSNTASFTKTGQGAASIRRAIWSEGVTNREDAFRVIDRRVLEKLQLTPEPRRVVDLGCGVGSSLLWLDERVPMLGIGVTVSIEQARIAERAFAGRNGLTAIHASYTELPDSIQDVQLAFAIESFAHAPSPAAFFEPIASRLRSGAHLMVCDDFLGPVRDEKLIADFQFGWVAASLVTPTEAARVAGEFGLELVANDDFTSQLELGRPRDRLLDVVVALGKPFKPKSWLFRSWRGGVALQSALKKRAIEHRLLTFVKK